MYNCNSVLRLQLKSMITGMRMHPRDFQLQVQCNHKADNTGYAVTLLKRQSDCNALAQCCNYALSTRN